MRRGDNQTIKVVDIDVGLEHQVNITRAPGMEVIQDLAHQLGIRQCRAAQCAAGNRPGDTGKLLDFLGKNFFDLSLVQTLAANKLSY